MPNTVLIVGDVQNDFCPGGALAVPRADDAVAPINSLIDKVKSQGGLIVYIADWHPREHCSFKAHGGIWPPHCIAGTEGARFHPDLHVGGPVFHKGEELDRDSYSSFGGKLDTPGKGEDRPSLLDYLRKNKVERVIATGLALDYCVKATALDAKKYGFKTAVFLPGTRAVNIEPGDGDRAVEEMRRQGIEILDSLPGK